MILKPVTSEKAVKLIDLENTLIFQVERQYRKGEIKTEAENTFNVKVDKVRTLIRNNKKYAYVKFKKEFLASDIATRFGMI